MVNPILQMLGGMQSPNPGSPQNGSIQSMINLVRGSANPDLAMQTLMQTNPQMQGVMNYIQQNGGDARTAFYNLAAQRGVNPNDIINSLK